jgi:hypothetical protein
MRYLVNTFFALLLVLFGACNLFNHKTSEPDYGQKGYVKAFVTEVSLDGCSFMLQLEDGKRLEPDGLQPEFEKDSLKVWLKYTEEDRMSVCMAGQTIKVIDIKKRYEK